MRKTLTRLALAGVAATALTGAAVAQIPAPPVPPAPPPPAMAPMPPMPPMPPMEALMAMGPNMMFMHQGGHADPEKRAQRLRDILQLRPDQDGALKAYVDATTMKIEVKRDIAIKDKGDKNGGEAKEWVERAPPTTLERLDHMSKAADMMKKRAEATRAFYMALTPAQQKTFDILGMGEGGLGGGGDHVFIRRFDTKGPAVFRSDDGRGERRVIIQRKVG